MFWFVCLMLAKIFWYDRRHDWIAWAIGAVLVLGFMLLLKPLLLAQPAIMRKRALQTGWTFSTSIARDDILSVKEMSSTSVTWIKCCVADPGKRTGVRTLWIIYFESLCEYQRTRAERLAVMCKLRETPPARRWLWDYRLWLQQPKRKKDSSACG